MCLLNCYSVCGLSVSLCVCVSVDDDSDVCNDIIRFCDRTSDKECALN